MLIKFDKQAAEKAGVMKVDSGAYVGQMQAITCVAKRTKSKGLELSLHGESDFNFINIYYERENGQTIKGGMGFINAMMGLLRLNGITTAIHNYDGGQTEYIPEFDTKKMGMVLQRRNYLKNDQMRTIGFKFDLVMVFDPATRKTCDEALNNKPAVAVDRILATLEDIDEAGVAEQRANPTQQAPNASQEYGRPTSKFDQVAQQSGGFIQQQAPAQQGGFTPQQQAPAQQGGFAPQQQAPAQQGGFAPQQQAPAHDAHLGQSDDEFFKT